LKLQLKILPMMVDVCVQTDCITETSECDMQTVTQLDGFKIQDFKTDPVNIKCYTGLENYILCIKGLASLRPAAFELTNLDCVNQFIRVPDQTF
jgi:hypothetical protein